MRVAFKEWAVVVDALGCGRQILIFRKGGIGEGPDGFQPEHKSFLLFPTFFHQQRDGVVDDAQIRFDEIQSVPPETVKIEYFAEVMTHRKLESFSQAEMLRRQHIWRDEVIEKRFDWGQHAGIHVLAVRVYRLAKPVELLLRSDYGGCKSWVQLDREIATEGSRPVLTDAEFNAKLVEFQKALQQAPVTLT